MDNNKHTAPFIKVSSNLLLLPQTTLHLKNLRQDVANLLYENDFVAFSGKDEYLHSDDGQLNAYGVLCSATKVNNDEQDEPLVKAYAKMRVRIVQFDPEAKTCAYYEDPIVEDLSEQAKADMQRYIQQIVDDIAKVFQGGRHIANRVREYESLNQMIVFLTQYMNLSTTETYEMLTIDSKKQQVTRFIDYLLRQKEEVALKMELNAKMTSEATDFYRRQAIERHIQKLKEQLGDEEGEEDNQNDYVSRIQALPLRETTQKALLEDARRLEKMNEQTQEAEVLRTYLDFALALPWKKEEAFHPDLKEARKILDEHHAGMDKVKERILQHLAVMQLRNSMKGSAILLVGPPGTGKTSLGKSIAKALRRPYTRLSLGGIRDESAIRGHRRTYVGAMSGRILKAMKQAGASNPVMILDEIDKMMAGGYSGDPAAAMLEVLDPEQNDTFTDQYLDLPFDLSDVLFIATANSLENIPAPLLDRMEVISLDSYTPSEKFVIAKDYLIPEVLEDHGIAPSDLIFEDEAIETIISSYTMEAGCRGLKKQIASIARTKAVDLIEQNHGPITIRSEDVFDILGPNQVRHEKVQESNPCGMVTGLAWTSVGGEVLFIETAAMPGSGQMILTGHLGDVMKESAKISYSVLKSRLPLDTLEFSKRDIHIHFPYGATPKDGPSAGITIFTALASLVLQKPVDSHIAMTGEISLSGQVLPIGGLKEKLYGAMRAGITKVLIPAQNEKDLVEVSQEVKDALNIVPVNTVEDVLKEALNIHIPTLEQPKLASEDAIVVI